MGLVSWKHASNKEVIFAWNHAYAAIMDGVTTYLSLRGDELTIAVKILEWQLNTIESLNIEIQARIDTYMRSSFWCCNSKSKKEQRVLQECLNNRHIIQLARSAIRQYEEQDAQRQKLFRPICQRIPVI